MDSQAAGNQTSVEDRINLHQLMQLKEAFDHADIDGGGSLDIEEFLEAFGDVLGKNLTREQLTHLFMKIDANSDGSVDWDEFTNFMLLENQAAADMSDRSYSERLTEDDPNGADPNPKQTHHRDMMDGILHLTKQVRAHSSSRPGRPRRREASGGPHASDTSAGKDTSTKDKIDQILSRSSARDPLRSRQHVPTFRSLHTHPLTDIAPSPRSHGGASPRV